ncbi:MAG: DUF4301 family protein [Thermoanaerobaculia bacterium]
MRTAFQFSAADREQLRRRGVSVAEAERQLDLLRDPPAAAALTRACRLGDGITVLADDERKALADAWDRATPELRVVKFVPASGAATRMFAFAEMGDPEAQHIDALVRGCDDLPFRTELDSLATIPWTELSRRPRELLRLIADDTGLGLASRPKGLIPFHRYDTGARTAFEEHLHEAAGYARGQAGAVRLHFTVPVEHRKSFEAARSDSSRRAAEATGAHFEIEFSTQDAATDTLGLTEDGSPLRSSSGELVFRPAGHGALLENLGQMNADVIFIKNVDNVAPAHRHATTAAWKKYLGGRLLDLRDRSFQLLNRLERDDPGAPADALRFCAEDLALALPEDLESRPVESLRPDLIGLLDRPIRVCGVVQNVGEPGGGPFWISDPAGIQRGQIVEGSQVNRGDPGQASIFDSATHFNPVDLACSVRNRNGELYELARYADPSTSFVADKRREGRPIRALERPGLWNGAMARWNTAFVEVPLATFTPVKSLLDLLRPEHQPG